MKITYKGNTYQELIDTTGDTGKSSFHIPEDDEELIEWLSDLDCINSDDFEEYEGKSYCTLRLSSWCKLSPETPLVVEGEDAFDYDFPEMDEDDDYDYWDWRQTVETLYHSKPEDYDTLIYLTAAQCLGGDWDDEEINSKRCKEEIEPIIPLIKRLYTYNNSIDN